jgi:hypothetical protein
MSGLLRRQPEGKLRGSEMTTHDDLRFAVETPSGGWDRRGLLPRPFTIFAARFPVVRLDSQWCGGM